MGMTLEQETETLQQQAAYLEDALKDIQRRIAELEKKQKKR